MASISSLTVPATLVGSLLVSAAGMGGSYMATKDRVARVESAVAANAQVIRSLEHDKAEHEAELREIKVELRYMGASLERIETRLGTQHER